MRKRRHHGEAERLAAAVGRPVGSHRHLGRRPPPHDRRGQRVGDVAGPHLQGESHGSAPPVREPGHEMAHQIEDQRVVAGLARRDDPRAERHRVSRGDVGEQAFAPHRHFPIAAKPAPDEQDRAPFSGQPDSPHIGADVPGRQRQHDALAAPDVGGGRSGLVRGGERSRLPAADLARPERSPRPGQRLACVEVQRAPGPGPEAGVAGVADRGVPPSIVEPGAERVGADRPERQQHEGRLQPPASIEQRDHRIQEEAQDRTEVGEQARPPAVTAPPRHPLADEQYDQRRPHGQRA